MVYRFKGCLYVYSIKVGVEMVCGDIVIFKVFLWGLYRGSRGESVFGGRS